MNRHIKHVTVLGTGVMGSGIACHLANIGVEVLLLDIPPRELTPKEEKAGLTLESKKVRNRIAQDNLTACLKSKPSPIYKKEFASRITVGNFDDDLQKIEKSDWVIEVIVERLDIKKMMFEKVDNFRKEGSLITSNTSGIPINLMAEGRSEDFKKNFCGTHFFNPPRYLRLFEIIPGPDTDQSVIDFFTKYAEVYLGKKAVFCKDTPGFIGNRVGMYALGNVQDVTSKLGMTIEEADALTGPVIGRPKTGTFKLTDLVGLDTAAHVATGLKENCPNDTFIQGLEEKPYMTFLMDNKFLGNKTKKGFYYKEKDAEGKTVRYALDITTNEYRPMERPDLPALKEAKKGKTLGAKISALVDAEGKVGDFAKKTFGGLFAYVADKVPEISDVIYSVDDAMITGYAWEKGPFQNWDMVGVQKGIEIAEAEGYPVAQWVKDMVASGKDSFYKVDESGKNLYYDLAAKDYVLIPGQDDTIVLDNIRSSKVLWSNDESSIFDLGDGILNIEFHSKMNSVGEGVLLGLQQAVDMAEKDYRGLVIANQGENFSVGANVGMIMMLIMGKQWEQLDEAVKAFQDTMMRLRYSDIPVIAAPHALTLGGGCEITLHADKVVASAETYTGLVELGVGLIPGGGGTKEFAKRALQGQMKDDVKVNRLREAFMSIAQAKVATSAYEAFDLNIYKEHRDVVVVNRERQIAEAKKQAIILSEAGYTRPIDEGCLVLGKSAKGMFNVGTHAMMYGGYITEYEKFMADKLGHVMAGGDLTEPTVVKEQYLLDLEREAFLSLAGEAKTLERIQHMLTKNKPLRN